MITLADLDRALDLMLQHDLQSLDLREGDARLSLRLGEAGAAPTTAIAEFTLRSRAIGRFLPAHPRRAEPQVRIGDRVEAATIVGFLQSGPALLPILAGRAGEVTRIDAISGSLLGFGDPVMTLLVEA